jgi:hypothetical protein
MIRAVLIVLFLWLVMAILMLMPGPVYSHDKWANGDPIPPWVSASCCGPADAHQLCPVKGPTSPLPDNCHERNGKPLLRTWAGMDGFYIEGYPSEGAAIGFDAQGVLPSQDGYVWAFFRKKYVNDLNSGHDSCYMYAENEEQRSKCPPSHTADIDYEKLDSWTKVYCYFVPMGN